MPSDPRPPADPEAVVAEIDRLIAESPEWEVPQCILDAREILADPGLSPPLSDSLAARLRYQIAGIQEAFEAIEDQDPGMLPSACKRLADCLVDLRQIAMDADALLSALSRLPELQDATGEAAPHLVYDVLVEKCRATDLIRGDFVRWFREGCPGKEWRFGGALGMGGKFYDDAYTGWRVGFYREDDTPERTAMIDAANAALKALAARLRSAAGEGKGDRT